MNKPLERKLALIAGWCGVIWIVGYVLSFGVLGHNYPPPSRSWTPQELVDRYFGPHQDSIMAGMVLCMVVGVFYYPWAAVKSMVMLRKEHRQPLLAAVNLIGGGITAWIVAEFPGKILNAARYGTTEPLLQMHAWREAWFIYDITYMITGFEMIAVGIYALTDKSSSPVWPRWTAYLAFAGVLSFVPEVLIPYFETGPLALDGLWNFWVAFILWLVWFAVYTFYLMRYLKRQIREQGDDMILLSHVEARAVELV